jgi:hypothetical protein
MLLSIPSVKKTPVFPQSYRPFSCYTHAPAASDAGDTVSVYVQISLSVTKLLIRKRF